MTIAAIIVLVIRLVFPLTILRRRSAGSLGSLFHDGADVILVDALASILGQEQGWEIITSLLINGLTGLLDRLKRSLLYDFQIFSYGIHQFRHRGRKILSEIVTKE